MRWVCLLLVAGCAPPAGDTLMAAPDLAAVDFAGVDFAGADFAGAAGKDLAGAGLTCSS